MRRIAKWSVLVLAVTFAFTLWLQSLASQQNPKIRFGYLVADQLHGAAAMVMKEKKMLEAEGFTVDWREFLAGSYLMQDFASGEIDFGVLGAAPVLITRGQGVDVVILASSNTEGSSIVVKDSIKTVKDLNGKSLGTPGVGSIQDALVDMVAKKENIKILHKHMKVSDMPIFLSKGEIDGFIAWAPHPARAVDLGVRAPAIDFPRCPSRSSMLRVVTKGSTLKSDPQTVEKVMKVYLKASKWYQGHRDEAIAMMGQKDGH